MSSMSDQKIVTTIDVLADRVREAERLVAEAEEDLASARSALRAVTDPTPLSSPYTCSECGLSLGSEMEFWSHFRVSDRRYPRLGSCPGHAEHAYVTVYAGELWCDTHDSTYPCPGEMI